MDIKTDLYIYISIFFSRIFKNCSLTNKYWKKFTAFTDYKLFNNKWNHYKIIPLGTYCLPRVITTVNKLKPSKLNGEKTLPFDLAFFKDMNKNIDLVINHFDDIFDEQKEGFSYDKENKYWINKKYNIIFNHEYNLNYAELKSLYEKRINNLYEYISDKSKHIFYLIAVFEPLSASKLEELYKYTKELRGDDKIDIIIINQSENKINLKIPYVHIINAFNYDLFNDINLWNNWVAHLKSSKSVQAKLFFRKITNDLRNIILSSI